MADPDAAGSTEIVRLLDAARDHALQQWQFDNMQVITIGRSPDREIVIPDTLISRLHVVLQRRGDLWWLLAVGQNGVQVDGERIEECPLVHGLKFRLGQNGPILQFCDARIPNDNQSNTALDFRLDDVPIQLDQDKLNRDVGEIVDGDYFKNLLAKADEIRNPPPGESRRR